MANKNFVILKTFLTPFSCLTGHNYAVQKKLCTENMGRFSIHTLKKGKYRQGFPNFLVQS